MLPLKLSPTEAAQRKRQQYWSSLNLSQNEGKESHPQDYTLPRGTALSLLTASLVLLRGISQSIIQKGVHTNRLTARDHEHWFCSILAICSCGFSGVDSANTLLCDTLGLSHSFWWTVTELGLLWETMLLPMVFLWGGGKLLHTILTETITSKKKIKTPGFGIFSLLNYESESETKSLGFYFYSKVWPVVVACACPTWPLRKQMRKKILGNLFAFPLRKRKQHKISRFSFVIISVRMVFDTSKKQVKRTLSAIYAITVWHFCGINWPHRQKSLHNPNSWKL